MLSALDLEAFDDREADKLEPNDIGRVRLRLEQALPVDAYADSRYTGSMILIDEETNATVGALMVEGERG